MDEPQRLEVGNLLRQGAWFGGLPPALQERILRGSGLRTFAKGQVVQVEEDTALGLVAVLEGQVLMLRHVNDDEPALIHVAGAGFWFGDLAVLLGDAVVTAVAQGPVRTLILPKREFDRIIADDPLYYPAFARLALERYRILVRFLAETLRLSPEYRLRLRLADLADLADTRQSPTKANGSAVVLDISQAELAGLIGLSRQKLNGRLRRLQDEGWVELGPRRIKVLDPRGLRATAAHRIVRDC